MLRIGDIISFKGDFMTLIEIFTDYVVNKKSLVEYVELRKTLNQRGEFNDETLILAQKNLDRLALENKEILDEMYAILFEIVKLDRGHCVEYSLDFIKEILKLYKNSVEPKDILKDYREILTHKYSGA